MLDLCGPITAGSTVLDPACGTGRFLLAVRERSPEVRLRGFETDGAALERARSQLDGAALEAVDFLEAPACGDVDVVVGNPPYLRDRGRKRDLYVDFLERSLDHLRDGGRLALVLSNAWLDVGYGAQVRTLLRQRCAIEWLVESASERWFAGASVNTMILVARRCDDPAERDAAKVRLAEVRGPLPCRPTVVREVRQAALPVDAPWGPQLRAPALWLRLIRGGRLVPLGELAEVRRGWTTNDNRFFYPPADSAIEPEYLRPVLKGPRRVRGVRFAGDQLPDQVFLCDLDRGELERLGHGGALDWIDRHGRETWALGEQAPARLFLVKGYHDRFRQPLAEAPVHADQQLYTVVSNDDVALAALLNSSWFQLSLELAGRVNFGDGVLWLGLKDARARIWLPDLRRVGGPARRRLVAAFEALPDDPVPPIGDLAADARWGPARAALDAEVSALLGVGPLEAVEIAAEGRRLCRRRLTLAGSVAARAGGSCP